VFRDTNERFYRLLEEFRAITGMGCLLNTSFNRAGEPMVETPADAYAAFCRSGLDMLVLNNYVVERDGKR
jgi:carbamoyltransferase